MYFFCGLGGYCHPWLESCFHEYFGFRHDAFNRHSFGDRGPSNLCLCQPNIWCQYWGLRLLLRIGGIIAVYVPSTTVAYGSAGFTPGAMVSS
jgi:hypothetical protein